MFFFRKPKRREPTGSFNPLSMMTAAIVIHERTLGKHSSLVLFGLEGTITQRDGCIIFRSNAENLRTVIERLDRLAKMSPTFRERIKANAQADQDAMNAPTHLLKSYRLG